MKIKLRAVVAILLIGFWLAAFLTGYLVWLAPSGPRSGWNILAFSLMKKEWISIHFWVSIIATLLTVVHMFLDWGALKSCVKYLCSTKRETLG
ncbi:MAG: DUF4405 domain-containing protein [Candidatus Saganbacteria bacterium]|nr:DUF4405 domain-containing protein [Candidatus Saganbacteria bacterium]